jgi:hypothetical protein
VESVPEAMALDLSQNKLCALDNLTVIMLKFLISKSFSLGETR